MPMGVDTANIVLVVIIVIVFFMLMSACCRQLRLAYEEHLTADELARRRRAFILASGEDGDDPRSVRVTAISHGGSGGDRVFGVYEIRVPRRGPGGIFGPRSQPPPPPFHTALQNSSPIYYIDPEDPPPSYDDYIKSQPEPKPEPIEPSLSLPSIPSPPSAVRPQSEAKERY